MLFQIITAIIFLKEFLNVEGEQSEQEQQEKKTKKKQKQDILRNNSPTNIKTKTKSDNNFRTSFN